MSRGARTRASRPFRRLVLGFSRGAGVFAPGGEERCAARVNAANSLARDPPSCLPRNEGGSGRRARIRRDRPPAAHMMRPRRASSTPACRGASCVETARQIAAAGCEAYHHAALEALPVHVGRTTRWTPELGRGPPSIRSTEPGPRSDGPPSSFGGVPPASTTAVQIESAAAARADVRRSDGESVPMLPSAKRSETV